MKKILKITAIVFVSLIVLLEVIPVAFKSKVNEVVKTEANKMLLAKIDFDNLGISLLRHFPHASISLSGLTVVGIDKFEGDTLASIDKIELVVNLASLFSSNGYELTRFIVNEPMLKARKLEDGAVNWNVMPTAEAAEETTAEPEDGGSVAFKLQVKEVKIVDGLLSYIDDSSKMAASVDKLNLRLSGDLSADRTALDLMLSLGAVNFTSGNINMLKDVAVKLDAEVDADLTNNRFELKDNTLSINSIELGVDGWAQLNADQSIDMDLKANTSKVQFKDILSLVPAFYTKDFKDLSASGELLFEAWIRGQYKGESIPAFDMTLKVVDGAFGYASLPAKVDNINILASATAPGGSMDEIVVDLNNLSLALAGNNLNVSFNARNLISDPKFAGKAVGVINLGAVKDVYPLGDSISLSGVITADMSVAAQMSDIEAQRFNNIKASGEFKINDMMLNLAGLPEVKIGTAQAKITPAQMSLDRFDLKIGRSDLMANGALTNYLPFIMKGDKLSGNLSISSNLMDLNEIMSIVPEESTDSEQTEVAEPAPITDETFRLPENMNLALNVSMKQILFQKMILENLKGNVTLAGGELKLNKLNMNAFDGTLATTGLFSTASNEPRVALNLNFNNASFATTFAQMDLIQKMVPLFKSAGGHYSLGMSLETKLDGELMPVYSSLQAEGKLITNDIKLQNIKALNILAETLKSDKLKNIEAKNVNVQFTIKDGQLITKPFKISMGNVTMDLSGATTIDGKIDYNGVVALPSGSNSLLSQVGVNIGGTFTSPKISVDVKNAVKDVAKGLLNEKLGNILGSSNNSSSTSSSESQGSSTDAVEQARAAGQKLVDAAKAQRDSLVNKANSKLAKIAAQTAGDALVKKAEQNAEKMVKEAEEKAAQK